MLNLGSLIRSAGDPTDKRIAVGLSLLVCAAVALCVWSIIGSLTPEWKKDLVYQECVDPACGHNYTLTTEAASVEWVRIPPQIRPGLTHTELPCPKCGRDGYSSARGFQCPKCKKFSLSPIARAQVRRRLGIPTQRPRGPVMCPHCGVDVRKHITEGRTTDDL